MLHASCLCEEVTWTVAGPVSAMSHCHCSRCRKAHGAAFATWVSMPASSLALEGRGAIASWHADGGGERCFCRQCGSVVPNVFGDVAFAPAGNFDEDPGVRPELHMFVGSRAPWYEIRDALPRFDAYPPGVDAPVLPTRAPLDPPGHPRGSCLCGAITFVVEGKPITQRYCHCTRCRKARSAAHAANMLTSAEGTRLTRGEDLIATYKVPHARYFTQTFCARCGSPVPRHDRARDIAVVPMGALDDDPGVRSTSHIFVGSKAPWFEIADDLPQLEAYPPA